MIFRISFYLVFAACFGVAVLNGFREMKNGSSLTEMLLLCIFVLASSLLYFFGKAHFVATEKVLIADNAPKEAKKAIAQVVLAQCVAVAVLVLYTFTFISRR